MSDMINNGDSRGQLGSMCNMLTRSEHNSQSCNPKTVPGLTQKARDTQSPKQSTRPKKR